MKSIIRLIPAMGMSILASTVFADNKAAPVASDGSFVNVLESASISNAKTLGYNGNIKLNAADTGADITPLTSEKVKQLNKLDDPKNTKIESVLGSDSRFKVDPYESNSNNYQKLSRYTVFISFVNNNQAKMCTGWLISKDTVATAGHCVHGGGSTGKWNSSATVYPAYGATNSPVAPFGSCAARRFYSVGGWTGSGNSDYDYGAIKLNCSIGNTVGWYGFQNRSTVNGLPAIIYGYPGDKPTRDPWITADVVRSSTAKRLVYLNDTYGGMSGSPIFYDDGVGRYVIGIHTNGGGSNNSGVRIDKSVFDNLVAWGKAL